MNQVTIVTHPLAQTHLVGIRDKTTGVDRFRWHMNRLAEVLFLEASEDLGTEIVSVESPLAKVEGVRLEKPLVLCPILRAGLGLAEGISPLVPEARVAHIGLARDEETAKATCYYAKFPPNLGDAEVFLLDPMLATGGSAVAAADQLKAAGARNLRFICVVGCQQGVEAFHDAHPEVPITTAAIDPGLNLQSYIVPGLGDAGDRYFGT